MVAVVAIFLDVRYILCDDNICQRVFFWIDVFEKTEPIVEIVEIAEPIVEIAEPIVEIVEIAEPIVEIVEIAEPIVEIVEIAELIVEIVEIAELIVEIIVASHFNCEECKFEMKRTEYNKHHTKCIDCFYPDSVRGKCFIILD
jgi:hypothetical protein